MTIQTLIDTGLFRVLAAGDQTREISKVFCCDLLSIAMSKAPSGCVWVTVMGNKNTLAVASLADISCVILAEDITFGDTEIACAAEEGMNVFQTSLPVFDAALKVHELLHL